MIAMIVKRTMTNKYVEYLRKTLIQKQATW